MHAMGKTVNGRLNFQIISITYFIECLLWALFDKVILSTIYWSFYFATFWWYILIIEDSIRNMDDVHTNCESHSAVWSLRMSKVSFFFLNTCQLQQLNKTSALSKLIYNVNRIYCTLASNLLNLSWHFRIRWISFWKISNISTDRV